MPLPGSRSGRPVKAVTLEFSADLFRGNIWEKDLKAIGLDVVDEAHATSELRFRGFGTDSAMTPDSFRDFSPPAHGRSSPPPHILPSRLHPFPGAVNSPQVVEGGSRRSGVSGTINDLDPTDLGTTLKHV